MATNLLETVAFPMSSHPIHSVHPSHTIHAVHPIPFLPSVLSLSLSILLTCQHIIPFLCITIKYIPVKTDPDTRREP